MLRDIEKELGIDDALAKESSLVTIRHDSRRYGKAVTILEGFDGEVDIGNVAKQLKHHLGTGGTVKEGRIELQGDHRLKVRQWLVDQGYNVAA